MNRARLAFTIFAAALTLSATAKAVNIEPTTIIDDGGQASTSHCSQWEAESTKIAYWIAAPRGTGWYRCAHIHGFTSDYTITSGCLNCNEETQWLIDFTFLPVPIDGYAWVPA